MVYNSVLEIMVNMVKLPLAKTGKQLQVSVLTNCLIAQHAPLVPTGSIESKNQVQKECYKFYLSEGKNLDKPNQITKSNRSKLIIRKLKNFADAV